jgi:hypothetical protein
VILGQLGDVWLELGRADEALTHHTRAVAAAEANLGPETNEYPAAYGSNPRHRKVFWVLPSALCAV